ncbi:hypothetical protein [Streptomyces sp. CB03911]|uniref:hypothetical protein n=1 Tax=Streptomyces sp. CB03911 TaxID=1804758 RepID=UPI000939BEB8|nr:hypothetical protein [Streptomyces sp. CB03911]OKI14246.1 hypothetical protein A6A07_13940 [Streptomyces sp. CB03911]
MSNTQGAPGGRGVPGGTVRTTDTGIRHLDFIEAAARILDDQPSARTVRSAGRRLQRNLIDLVEEIAGKRTC